MTFQNKWQTMTPAELEEILDQAFKAVAAKVIEARGKQS